MYFLTLAAHPKPTHASYGVTDGAWAACWVAVDDPSVAEERARLTLGAAGWDTDELDEAYPIARDEVADAEGLERFDQAVVDGIAITLHAWPVGAPDDD